LKLHRLDAGSDEYVREFRQIQRINRMVNGRVHQQTDNDLYGLADYWVRAGMGNNARGDCEDIAIEKRFQLLKAGFAPERLSFAVVYQAEIGLHTVLVARTDHGDLVLDSRNDALRQWDSTPYRWLSVQDFNAPAIWHTVASL
jgi:predicted transglutaminase-like cysteine proteinase